MSDEPFHEIHLNGKQLVFLFMAATVVSVVIFLCGVLVGRGVRAERATTVDTSTVASTAETTPPPTAMAAPVATPAGSDPTKAATPPAAEDLSYFNRLEKPNTQAEQLKPAQESRAAVPEKPASRPEKLERKIEKPAPAPAP